MEHQAPQVAPYLNKKEQLVEWLVTDLGCPGGTPGSTSSFRSEYKGTIGKMSSHPSGCPVGTPGSTSSSRSELKGTVGKMSHKVPQAVPDLLKINNW